MELSTVNVVGESPAPVASCPVCGSSRIAPFMVATDNGHLRRDDIKLPVHRCGACDVFFLNPPPPAEIGREYFAEAYAGRAAGNIYYDDRFKDSTSKVRLRVLAQHVPHGGRLLDVGCGKGRFVKVARELGWDAWGVELDEGACTQAQQQLGLSTVLNGSVDHPLLPESFDVVTLWDVIEHVPDPVGIFRAVAQKLRPGGILAVRTANIRSWAFDRNRARWWAFGSDHRFYFSPQSLGVAMKAAGLTVSGVINGELMERPDKRPSPDISETSVGDGLLSVTRAPRKVLKVGQYGRNLVRRVSGDWKYGSHYRTSIMTVIGTKPGERTT